MCTLYRVGEPVGLHTLYTAGAFVVALLMCIIFDEVDKVVICMTNDGSCITNDEFCIQNETGRQGLRWSAATFLVRALCRRAR